jgi:hypothetical protein
MRQDNSALTIAYEDPVLRSAGLKDDSYGAALGFFGLSHGGLHKIICHCHFGDSISAERAATVIRSVASRPPIGVAHKLMLCGVAAMLLASAALAVVS